MAQIKPPFQAPRGYLSLEELVGRTNELISPPEIHWQLEAQLESPGSNWENFADIISQDPNLSARLLSIANSAFYSGRGIDTPSWAVALIGTRTLYDLAIGVAAMGTFQRVRIDSIDISMLWRHSLSTGLTAQLLAKNCHILHPERMFVAGLLHDVGRLALHMHLPELMREIFEIARDEYHLTQHERSALGFDHAQLGAAIMESWRLPRSIVDAIRYHHRPREAVNPSLDASIVHLADLYAPLNGERDRADEEHDAQPIHGDLTAWALTGLTQDIWADIIPEIHQALDETEALGFGGQ